MSVHYLRKNLHYALKLAPDKIFILSAKYGLVGLDEEIEPYDLTLNTMLAKEIKHWADGVLHQLAESKLIYKTTNSSFLPERNIVNT